MNKVLAVFVLAAACLSAQDGTVVVYRQGKYVGSALKPSVYVDGNEVGRSAVTSTLTGNLWAAPLRRFSCLQGST